MQLLTRSLPLTTTPTRFGKRAKCMLPSRKQNYCC
jgi:hypothetical protein